MVRLFRGDPCRDMPLLTLPTIASRRRLLAWALVLLSVVLLFARSAARQRRFFWSDSPATRSTACS